MDIIHIHMKTILHSGVSRLQTLIYALALLVILPACTDDADRELPEKGKVGTVTLELSLSVPPIVETKAVICEADSGSEARKAGFYYEMQVQTTDTTGNAGGHVATKAASSLKNIYAFLFKISDGKFNGRASIKGPVNLDKKLMLAFSGVTDVDSRLVVIANDAAGADYTSSKDFANFSATYTEFQDLMLTSDIILDADIPYVGSATVSLSEGLFTATSNVLLYRMLAKITLTNNYAIDDGVLRNSIILYNAGNKYFGTPNNGGDGYNGEGSTATASGRYSSIIGKNEDSNTWYVGENVQADTTNAAYIEFLAVGEGSNTNPSVGEEFKISGYALRHKVYLNGYALKRNNVYTIKVNMSGNFDFHKELATTNPNVSYTESEVVHCGLNIGKFGGASNYSTGNGYAPSVTGTYTKYLLLQPNTSGSTDKDNIGKRWGAYNSSLQRETRKYWDPTYTLAEGHIDKTAGYAYDYCYNLTIGGVAKGTWYLPTLEQLYAIWGIYKIKDNSSYAYYSAFPSYLLSSTEENAKEVRCLGFPGGYGYNIKKNSAYSVRCVRDLPSDDLSAQTVITVSGYPVIDLSTLHPLGVVLSYEAASARRTLMNQQTPSNSAYLRVGEQVSDNGGTWNAQMSGKFQVMRANHSEAPIDWASAYNMCKNYKGEGGGAGQWRLPTSRELMMTWVLHPQLIGKGGFTAFLANNGYWSLTEQVEDGAYFLDTSTASNNYDFGNKTTNYSVRCVRDL